MEMIKNFYNGSETTGTEEERPVAYFKRDWSNRVFGYLVTYNINTSDII
jgi:hypothetical protein